MTFKMNFRKRILLGYLVPLLLMLGVALAVYLNTGTLQRDFIFARPLARQVDRNT